jgi:hypothetical protein
MATLLFAGIGDQVRAALDVSLDPSALPDATISLPIFVDGAEADILATDPNALTYLVTDAARARVERAFIYLTAAYIAPTLPAITGEQVGGDRYSRAAWDGAKRAAELRGLANAELAAYLNPSGQVEPLFSFGLACGRRGR